MHVGIWIGWVVVGGETDDCLQSLGCMPCMMWIMVGGKRIGLE